MSDTLVSVEVTGDRQIAAAMRAAGPRVHVALARAITRATLQLTAAVKSTKLSGQVLRARTGTLRRSINGQVTDDGTTITGSVGTNVVYARVHEMGFTGTVQVRAHVRRIKEAFGRTLKQPVTVRVGAHAMHMHLPERSFLRSALRDLQPSIAADVRAAVQQAVGHA